ncbi:MAG TPA: peptidoglycan-associated lipoprotein Pal [Noviherbaspirillum sp.]|nr:peptidoglycan-associated lipoprotein Pal [Noviherbaspirillum sp.]
MRTLKALPLTLSAMFLLAACSSAPKLDNTAAQAKPAAPATDSRTVTPVSAGTVDPLNDPNGTLAKRSVYFDFDQYTVKDQFKPVVTAHGDYLSHNKARKIVIQGNADERGSSEYNLALGQKRAEAVRKSLAAVGVTDAQMEAVSFGKEKPKATGHDEAAWAENRRADIVYGAN